MNYRSNLEAPDLALDFPHMSYARMPHAFGHGVPHDWADKRDDDPKFGLWKRCGSWTADERAILFNVARSIADTVAFHDAQSRWLDIGCNTGLTSVTINAATNRVVDCVDYILADPEFRERFALNTKFPRQWMMPVKSDAFFANVSPGPIYHGVVIDGDHDAPQPLRDAVNTEQRLKTPGVILLHDFIGRPVRDAVEYLMMAGFNARIYLTPHMIACCWRGEWTPPDHTPDPNLPDLRARCLWFPWERTV